MSSYNLRNTKKRAGNETVDTEEEKPKLIKLEEGLAECKLEDILPKVEDIVATEIFVNIDMKIEDEEMIDVVSFPVPGPVTTALPEISTADVVLTGSAGPSVENNLIDSYSQLCHDVDADLAPCFASVLLSLQEAEDEAPLRKYQDSLPIKMGEIFARLTWLVERHEYFKEHFIACRNIQKEQEQTYDILELLSANGPWSEPLLRPDSILETLVQRAPLQNKVDFYKRRMNEVNEEIKKVQDKLATLFDAYHLNERIRNEVIERAERFKPNMLNFMKNLKY